MNSERNSDPTPTKPPPHYIYLLLFLFPTYCNSTCRSHCHKNAQISRSHSLPQHPQELHRLVHRQQRPTPRHNTRRCQSASRMSWPHSRRHSRELATFLLAVTRTQHWWQLQGGDSTGPPLPSPRQGISRRTHSLFRHQDGHSTRHDYRQGVLCTR